MSQIQTRRSLVYVRDIMKSPVHTVRMDDSLQVAKEIFDRKRCHHLVVLERRQVWGVLSDRDILKAVSPFAGKRMMERTQDVTTLRKRVHQIMSRDPITVGANETVADAAVKMLAERVSCLPVVNDERAPLGIVTIRDLVGWSVGASPPSEEDAGDSEQDEGIVIIIDGARCYHPHKAIARQIRGAERFFERTDGFGSAAPKNLPNVAPVTAAPQPDSMRS